MILRKTCEFLVSALFLAIPSLSFALSVDDKALIEKNIAGYTEAWNRRDMKAFSEAYTKDASFINVLGETYLGRSAIENRHLKMHQKKDSRLEVKDITLREIRPDVVIALVQWQVIHSGIPKSADATSDTRHGILTQVFLKEGGQWLVTASHNTFTGK